LAGVYTDTWIDTPTEDFDELAPNPPVVVSYSVGEVDPSAPDQTISVHISLVSENGRTVTVDASGYAAASAIATMPMVYDAAGDYEIGTYSTVTTYTSNFESVTTSGFSVVGVSFTCFVLSWDNPAIRTAFMVRKEPCNSACSSPGNTLTFRYNPARGAPYQAVAAEPYTKIGSIRLCSHVSTVTRYSGVCECGNVDIPTIIPNIPIGPILNFCGPQTFINKCYMYGGDYDFDTCTCLGCASCGGSPILIDINGDGYSLTSAADGVPFDLEATGLKRSWSWTASGSDDAWLVLDRNNNRKIDDGGELFGNFTHQPASDEPNGFIALAQYDSFANGGNGDGIIDNNDHIFSRLRLWRDITHDGISQPAELFSLPALDVVSIALDYKTSKRTDSFGNRFRYRAKVAAVQHAHVNRWAWDVFLVPQP
jgi:hypothetical protein